MSHGPDSELLEYYFNHEQDGLSWLKGQFDDSPNLRDLLAVFLKQIQEIDNAVVDTVRSRLLDHATGDALDQYGKIVGVSRGRLEEFEYRRFIRARIKSNNSEATINDVVDIFVTLTQPLETKFFEHFPAGYSINGDVQTIPEDSKIAKMVDILEFGQPSGVSTTYSVSEQNSFRFNDEDRGFGTYLSTEVIE